jgi:hypothetical protein
MALAMLEIIFVFLFVDLFDNVGTLVAVTKKAGLQAPDGSIPRLNRILLADSAATMVGAHGRHLDRGQLYRERLGRHGRRPHRPDGRRGRACCSWSPCSSPRWSRRSRPPPRPRP